MILLLSSSTPTEPLPISSPFNPQVSHHLLFLFFTIFKAKPCKSLLFPPFFFLCRLISMSRKGAVALQKDVPWRASATGAPIPKIHLSPVLRVPQNLHSSYALSIIKNNDPIGNGLAVDAVLESAGPECIVPGQAVPIKLLGLKVWPIEIDLKFLEPVGRELKSVGRILDAAMNLADRAHFNR